MEKLTQQEEEAMLIVWQQGEGTIRSYHEQSGKPLMPYTTFASIIKNLDRKKYLKMRRVGTTNLCKPLISEKEYKRKFMSAREEKISADDLKEIIRIIEKQK